MINKGSKCDAKKNEDKRKLENENENGETKCDGEDARLDDRECHRLG